MTYSPVTTEWLGLPEDIRSAAETAVGHLRPLTHAETLLIVGRAIKAERERCAVAAERLASDRRAREKSYGYGPGTATPVANAFWCEEIAEAIRQGDISPPKPEAVSEGGEDE